MAGVDVIQVVGGARLAGEVHVVGAKNSALKLMAASLLADGVYELANVPDLVDVSDVGDDGLRLVTADVVEGLVDPPLQPALGVQRRSPVADQDEHNRQ